MSTASGAERMTGTSTSSTRYTFVGLLDGQRIGSSDDNTLQDVNDLMECIMCPHDACPSVAFMESLYAVGAAMMVTPHPNGVGVSLAYLNKEV